MSSSGGSSMARRGKARPLGVCTTVQYFFLHPTKPPQIFARHDSSCDQQFFKVFRPKSSGPGLPGVCTTVQ